MTCPFCETPDCPRFIMIEEKRKNPPRGMGAGLWMHGEPFREAHSECGKRCRAKANNESWEYRCQSCGANLAEVVVDGVKLPRVEHRVSASDNAPRNPRNVGCDDCLAGGKRKL